MKNLYFQIAVGTGTLSLSFSFAPFNWVWFHNISKNGFCFMVGPFVVGGMQQSPEMMKAAIKNFEAT